MPISAVNLHIISINYNKFHLSLSTSFLKKAGQKLLFPPLLECNVLQMGGDFTYADGYVCRGELRSPA